MTPRLWIALALAFLSGAQGATAQTPPVAPADTPRVAAIEYSDWYGRRLTIHRVASYTMLPLFAAQYAAGRQLLNDPGDADWARRVHKPLAYGVGALFTVNTVTGVWNLWEARKDPEGRGRRTAHALLMLAGDAGFATTGYLGNRAARHGGDRELHRNVALGSMAVAVTGYLLMLPQLWED
jgi:hypothetical protein